VLSHLSGIFVRFFEIFTKS
jgi:hypothetical protein